MTELSARIANLTPEQRALLTTRLGKTTSRQVSSPVAIIGAGCRFPGGGVSPEAFWANLIAGVDAVTEVPADRWLIGQTVPSSEPGPPQSRWGAFLREVDRFDRDFFGLSPREAAHMDPQQRLLMETAWEALEDAGQMTDSLAESLTGVFIGAQSHSSDYYLLQAGAQGRLDTYTATGTAHSILANRLSFILDLRGPSMAVDTACSSSLVAVHLACQSLKTGESDLAIAGGVNLMLTPDFHGCLSMMEMMAPDGRCKTFDHRANGFVRGEGCGVVVLKRLADAINDADPVLAVILGSAVNQDGASNGLTAPNGLAQQAVIRRALDTAQVKPDEVGYVETHGTGTKLGDPIEVEALAEVLRSGRGEHSPCVLGAVKSNIGHLEAASGIAGLIKAALCLKHEAIPANLHLEAVNPHLANHAASFALPLEPKPWPRSGRRRVAGVSSFGFGGSNAHVILAEAPAPAAPAASADAQEAMLLPLSARSEGALRALVEAHVEFLNGPGADLASADLAYTAARRRLHHDHRLCAVGAGAAQWAASLKQQLAEGPRPPAGDGRAEIVFVFSGQGVQRPQAGAQLLEREPVFRQVMEACDAALGRHVRISLIDEIKTASTRPKRADIGQPAHVALQLALTALWRSWGVQPTRIVGHSLGEIAAAHAAGALSLDQAITVAFHRGRVVREAAGLGGMSLVGLSREDAQALIDSRDPAICISVVNSPVSCVLSGPTAKLTALTKELGERGVFARTLDIDYPSHSPAMEPFSLALKTALADLAPSPSQIPIVSSVTGAFSSPGAFDADYWALNLRQPVQFAQAIETLFQDGGSTFLEIGCQPVLRLAIEQCETAASGPIIVAASLERDRPERSAMLEGAATLYGTGVDLDWAQLSPSAGRCVVLPRYPWERQRCWLPGAPHQAVQSVPEAAAGRSGAGFPADWLYELAWRTMDDDRDAPSVLASVDLEQSAAFIKPLIAQLASVREGDATVRRWLDDTCAGYIVDALRVLGGDLTPGALWPKQGLVGALGVLPRFERLLHRMIAILVDRGMWREEPEGWRVGSAARSVVEDAAGAAEPASSLLKRCGPSLADVLRGDIEPLSLLFAEGSSTAEAIYRDAAPSKRSNQVLQAALAGWLAALPANRPVRILEIGAGTGATTAALLPLLPKGRCEYVFTDVSTHFLRQAGETFADLPFMRYALLDLEQDPAAQGFAAGAFDLIVAANVMHATANLRSSLARANALLAEGGILALVECTPACPWMDLTFGLTDGWWRFTDSPLRTDYPLLDEGQWGRLLCEAGFEAAQALPLQGDAGDPLFDQALLLAQKSTSARAGSQMEGRRHLILEAGSATAVALTRQLRARGDDCVVVDTAAELDSLSGDKLTDFATAIYFAPEQPSDLSDSTARLLAWVQTFIRTGMSPERGLWIVTRGGQAWGSARPEAGAHSLLWGFGRGVSLEAPQLAPTLIDLDPVMDADLAAAALLRTLDKPTGEDQIILRGADRHVPRIRRLAVEALAGGPAFEARGVHLITGGLGGIGRRLALELAGAGASELILVVNRPVPERAAWSQYREGDSDFPRIDTIRQLEDAGVTVSVEALDLTDTKALEDLFASSAMAGKALRGVWHAAFALVPQNLATMSEGDLRTAVVVKAQAALQLHQLTQGQPLDQFFLFSSTTGLWGARSMAHYAAANAFLDTLAHQRRSEGLPATVVNWGTWEIMERLSTDQQSEARRAGLNPMAAASALSALKQVTACARTQTIVADVDWSRFRPAYEAMRPRPLLSELGAPRREAPAAAPDHGPVGSGAHLTLLLDKAPPLERAEIIQAFVRRTFASVLGIDPESPIDPDRGFFELGMDSLTSVQLRRRLEAALARPLATTVAFKHPTIQSLSEHIREILFPAPAPAPAPAPSPATPLLLPAAPQNQRDSAKTPAQAAPVERPPGEAPAQAEASEDELFELLAARLSPGRT